jgi:hypothetical protein
LLKRGFLGWLRGERGHCSMVRVPTIAEEVSPPSTARPRRTSSRRRAGDRRPAGRCLCSRVPRRARSRSAFRCRAPARPGGRGDRSSTAFAPTRAASQR